MAYNDYKKKIVQSRWHLVYFCFIELICLILVVSSNKNQRIIFDNSLGIFKNRVNQRFSNLTNYMNLENVVDSLVEENARLIQEMNNKKFGSGFDDQSGITDYYDLIPTKVISRTTGRRKNYLVVDKGNSGGVEEGSAVISNKGIVGTVTSTTDNFSRVMTLCHSDSKVSVRIGSKNQFGVMTWKPWTKNTFLVQDFPKYWEVTKGDTVFTSGYSTLFPTDIAIGRVSSMDQAKSTNNRLIELELFIDIDGENNLYVLKNNYRAQLDTLLRYEE